tara:strand:- start:128530 stop:129441 length:912 start_codon:yes stop_codon:yes gene_type:complete
VNFIVILTSFVLLIGCTESRNHKKFDDLAKYHLTKVFQLEKDFKASNKVAREVANFYYILKQANLVYSEEKPDPNKKSIGYPELLRELEKVSSDKINNAKEITMAYFLAKNNAPKEIIEEHIKKAISGEIDFAVEQLHQSLMVLMKESDFAKEENYFEIVGIFTKSPTPSVHRFANYIKKNFPQHLREFSKQLYRGAKNDPYMRSHNFIKIMALNYQVRTYENCEKNKECLEAANELNNFKNKSRLTKADDTLYSFLEKEVGLKSKKNEQIVIDLKKKLKDLAFKKKFTELVHKTELWQNISI